jgi:hypothetical protein
MPACRDPQHERFARELTEEYLKIPPSSNPVFEAFKRAGFAPHKGNATRLNKRHEIRARVRELLDEYREYVDIRPIKCLVRVDRIADAKMPDYFGDDGRTLLNIKKLPPRLAEAIKKLKFNDEGGVDEFELHDKGQANFALIKHFGGMPEPEHNEVNIFNVLSVEDQRVLADFIEALAKGSRSALPGAAPERRPEGEAA